MARIAVLALLGLAGGLALVVGIRRVLEAPGAGNVAIPDAPSIPPGSPQGSAPPGEKGTADDPRPPRTADAFVLVPRTRDASGALGVNLDVDGGLRFALDRARERHGLRFPDDLIWAVHSHLFPALPPGLIRAIIERENAPLNPDAERFESNVQDFSVGLMQVRTDTAAWLDRFLFAGRSSEAIRDRLRDPLINVAVGSKYLEYQRRGYSFQPDLVALETPAAWIAAAYNAGTARYNFRQRKFSNDSYVRFVTSRIERFDARFPIRRG